MSETPRVSATTVIISTLAALAVVLVGLLAVSNSRATPVAATSTTSTQTTPAPAPSTDTAGVRFIADYEYLTGDYIAASEEDAFVELGYAICDSLTSGVHPFDIIDVGVANGFTDEQAVSTVVAAVDDLCPANQPILDAVANGGSSDYSA